MINFLVLQIDAHIESLKNKVETMRKAADLIESWFPYRNQIWIKTMDKKISNDIINISEDLEHEERNGRSRHTTWAKGKGKKMRRRVSNTMGYVSQTPSHE